MGAVRNSGFLRKGSAMSKLIDSLQFLTTPKEQGGGFTFTPAPVADDSSSAEQSEPEQFLILVVDDDDAFRMLLEDTLTREEYSVTTAPDGDAAIELIQRHYYDLVLLDIMLPTISGFEVLKFIKDHVPSTKVIMLTGYSDLKLAVEAKKLGAHDFIGKPFMRADLLNTIKNVLAE